MKKYHQSYAPSKEPNIMFLDAGIIQTSKNTEKCGKKLIFLPLCVFCFGITFVVGTWKEVTE